MKPTNPIAPTLLQHAAGVSEKQPCMTLAHYTAMKSYISMYRRVAVQYNHVQKSHKYSHKRSNKGCRLAAKNMPVRPAASNNFAR